VELAGPPGVVKTTRLRLLCQHDKKDFARHPTSQNNVYPPFYPQSFYWLPVFLRRYLQGRWFTWGELRTLTLRIERIKVR
jgi:hypothetical protein